MTVGAEPADPATDCPELPMSTTRCIAALVLAASLGGCASVGAGVARVSPAPSALGAEDALDLLRLVEEVEAASIVASASR